jgi:hypothetical protein
MQKVSGTHTGGVLALSSPPHLGLPLQDIHHGLLIAVVMTPGPGSRFNPERSRP